jgi:hypothetical protein
VFSGAKIAIKFQKTKKQIHIIAYLQLQNKQILKFVNYLRFQVLKANSR